MQQISVELIGANGSRTTEVKAQGFTTRHVITPRESIPSIFGDIKLGDRKPAPGAPKMPSEQHQNDRFLAGIKATLKISGKWLTAPSVFHHFYDKYNLVELRDIEIGLDGLAKAGEIQAKVVDGEKQYHLPTSDFERLLNRCQVSKYHLAEITGIDEAVMCSYCKGAEISTAAARMIADKLNIELSELDGIIEVRTAQNPAIAFDTNARGEVLSAWGDVMEVRA